jgi:hypothetical protein
MILWIILGFVAIFLFYKWSISNYDYFEKQGVAFRKPVPFFGANLNMFWNRQPITDLIQKWYHEFEDEK